MTRAALLLVKKKKCWRHEGTEFKQYSIKYPTAIKSGIS
jgi:hypothetical protein